MRVDVELGVDMLDVGLDGIARHTQSLLDVLAVAPARKHLEHLGLAGRELMIGRHLGATLGKNLIGRNVHPDVGLRRHDALNRGAQRETAQAEEHVRDERQQQKGNELGKLLAAVCNLDAVCRGAQKGT